MKCLRCGFPWSDAPCGLCGWSDDPRYAYGGSEPAADAPFFITVRFPRADPNNDAGRLVMARAAARAGRDLFVLFDLSGVDGLVKCLNTADSRTEMYFNGILRPLAQELWVPMLRFFEHGETEKSQ
ncbi:hypothetical protein JW905_01915 [bacterium]|nr:hypothetical protein [candidate division CSSED10-310 bacterium]